MRLSRYVSAMSATALALAVMLAGASPTAAFCLGPRWASGSVHQAWGTEDIPVQFRDSVERGVTGWNVVPFSSWRISYVAPGPLGPPGNGGWIFWDNQGNGFPGFGGAPGVTRFWVNPQSTVVAANTWMNPGFVWNENGVMNKAQAKADVLTVALHELGHWLVLVHPQDCGPMTTAEISAVMNPNWQMKQNLRPDDANAVLAQY